MNLRLFKLISFKYEYYSIVQVLFAEVGFPLELIWESVRGPLGISEGSILGPRVSVWGYEGSV